MDQKQKAQSDRRPRVPDLLDCAIVAVIVSIPACIVLGVMAILLTGPYTPLLPLALPGGVLIGIFFSSRWRRRSLKSR